VCNQSIWIFCLIWFPLILSRSLAGAEPPILPTPQFHQILEGELTLPKGAAEVVFVLPARVEPSIRVATQLTLQGLKEAGIEAKVVERKAQQALEKKSAFKVLLLPFSELPISLHRSILTSEDRGLLTKKNSSGQEYVLVTRPHENAAYLVGQTGQGVLYAAASLLQLMTSAVDQVRIPAIHIRDFPDIKYRMAADW
jgi:hypothetical protein